MTRWQRYSMMVRLLLRQVLVKCGMVWQSPPGGFRLAKGAARIFHPTRGPAWIPGTPMLDAPNGAVIVHQDGRCKLRSVVGNGYQWRVISPALAAAILKKQQGAMVRRRAMAGALAGALLAFGVFR